MEYTKQLLTLQQQIEVLKQRGLQIDNDAAAKDVLDSISYFRLAGYWRLMEADKQKHTFKPGSRFSHIVSLYHFDEELRLLLFSSIQQIDALFLRGRTSNTDSSRWPSSKETAYLIQTIVSSRD